MASRRRPAAAPTLTVRQRARQVPQMERVRAAGHLAVVVGAHLTAHRRASDCPRRRPAGAALRRSRRHWRASLTWAEVGALRVAAVVVAVERPLPGVGDLWRRARIHSRVGGHFATAQTSISASGLLRHGYDTALRCARSHHFLLSLDSRSLRAARSMDADRLIGEETATCHAGR